jgi:hypothetical protein
MAFLMLNQVLPLIGLKVEYLSYDSEWTDDQKFKAITHDISLAQIAAVDLVGLDRTLAELIAVDESTKNVFVFITEFDDNGNVTKIEQRKSQSPLEWVDLGNPTGTTSCIGPPAPPCPSQLDAITKRLYKPHRVTMKDDKQGPFEGYVEETLDKIIVHTEPPNIEPYQIDGSATSVPRKETDEIIATVAKDKVRSVCLVERHA